MKTKTFAAVGCICLFGLLAGCSRKSELTTLPPAPKTPTVEEYAATLRSRHAAVHIYLVSSNRYEVWCDAYSPKKWREADTLEQARKIVNDYYLEWAKNCIGDQPTGTKIE